MSSANNIEGLRQQRGWKRPELARRMGTSPQQVERLEKDQRRLTRDWIDRAAEAFGVPAVDIIGDLPPADMRAAPPLSDQPRVVVAAQADGAVGIRSLDLNYAMGSGANPEDYPGETPVLFDPNFLRILTRAEPDRLFVARGDGDSMFPTLVNGDQVLVDTTQRTLTMQDKIWAVSVHGASMIKRLRSIGKGRVRILSDNPVVPMEEVDAEDLHIVGRVIWVGRRL